MRGHKWKILEVAMERDEVTSLDFAQATGRPADEMSPYAQALVADGYLRLLREVPMARGGRPQKIYKWTGKKPSQGYHDYEQARIRANQMVANCFSSMVRCRERGDAISSLAPAM